MRTRLPRLSLEGSLFDERPPPFVSRGGAILEAAHTQFSQPTGGAAAAVIGADKSGRGEVVEFFALPPQWQAVELTNALLRQFAFRTYKAARPDIIPAFNNALPRTVHSLTRRPLVLALLEEMGLTEESGAVADEAERGDVASACNRPRRVASNDSSAVPGWERRETVLERLLRRVLRQFHARHAGQCRAVYADPAADASGGAGGGRDIRTGCLRELPTGRRASNAVPGECGSAAHVASPLEARQRDTRALRKFFVDHPTEDEQVFVIANELLQQHIATPHVLPATTHLSADAASEREFGANNDALAHLRISRLNTPDSSSCDNKKEDGGRLPQERLVLLELLRSVHETSMSARALFAIFKKALHWPCCSSVRAPPPLDATISALKPIRSSQTSTEAAFRQGGPQRTAGDEPQDTHDTFGRERRRRLPSLLCLYLQSHLQERPPSMENVNRRMLRMKWEDPQLVNCSVSWRENSSAGPFSPCMYSEPCSNTLSMTHSKFTSPSKIVSVQCMDGTTRIGRGSSGELFAVRRLDTGELVAVKRIYLTELSREHVESELSVLRRSIGLSDDGRGNGSSSRPGVAASVTPSSPRGMSGNSNDDDGDSDVADYNGVVRFYDAFFDDGCAFIVMELMDSGSLFDALNARRCRPFSEEECRAIAFQVLHGLRYLHDTIRQLHRDLKPHNILLDRHTGAVKLTDFGISSDQLQSMGFNQCDTYVGTLAYMSPNRVDAASVYGKESDFWGLGITLIQLALGKLPFLPNVFVIAGFATRPPRLSSNFASDSARTSTLGEAGTRRSPPLTAFSDAFQDFVATLLPATRGRSHAAPLASAAEDDEDSAQSCTHSLGGWGGSELSCTPAAAAAECAGDAAEGSGPSDMSEACVGYDVLVPFAAWTAAQSRPPDAPAGAAQEPPSPWARSNEKENGSRHMRAGGDDFDDARRGGTAAAAELTSTALLQHPWMRGMTWEKSRTVIAAISLDSAAAPH
ncbi:putative protein kinase [Trypanosoma conorhini]|uniref:mitogen-activated protein kinase kinase n=1 Tax=Trypanosoma conorhini TaxID=83891 RepID=A0A3R7KWF5_9TRYP|nr:putative protein kinase [Trypanosoma conorhini]RNF02736.1 putative protein kinase [Trypanosoma conorhini]